MTHHSNAPAGVIAFTPHMPLHAHIRPESPEDAPERQEPEIDRPGQSPADETDTQRERRNDPRRDVDPEPVRKRIGVSEIGLD